MNYHFYLPLVIVLCVFFVACLEPPKFDDIPEITMVELDKNLLKSDTDKFLIKIHFQDGDGDFGFENVEDEKDNIIITDSRTCFVDKYKIPKIEENGNINDISGVISVVNTEQCVLKWKPDPENPAQNIIDNAGNMSNVFTSPELYIECN